jgi:DNA polymerase/3'-5' exonuclease PolX
MSYSIDYIFEYTEKEIDNFLQTRWENISSYTLNEKRYLLTYFLDKEKYLNDELINNPKFQEAMIQSNTIEELRDYLNPDIREKIYQTLIDIAYYEGAFGEKYKEKMFEKASLAFNNYEGSIDELINPNKKLRIKVPDIGNSSLEIIEDIVESGQSNRLILLENKAEPIREKLDIIKLFSTVYGIGRVTAEKLYDKGYRTISDLQNTTTYKFTTDQLIGLKYYTDLKERITRTEMIYWQNEITELVGAPPEDEDDNLYWTIAGSYIRGESTSGDIDIIVRESSVGNMATKLLPIIKEYLLSGAKKIIAIIKTKDSRYRQMDIRAFTKDQWPFGLLYNSSGKNFNILIREYAKKKGYHLDEYQMINLSNGKEVVAKTERDVFTVLGLQYLKPTERLKTISRLPEF